MSSTGTRVWNQADDFAGIFTGILQYRIGIKFGLCFVEKNLVTNRLMLCFQQ